MLKTFTVEWDNYEEVTKLGSKIKTRLGVINPNRLSKRQKEGFLFDSCMKIFNCDTSSHYQLLNLDSTPKYYVYCHMNGQWKIWPNHSGRLSFAAILGITHSPFYIGKGTGSRSKNLNRNGYHKKLKDAFEENGSDIENFIIKDNLTEFEAIALEDKLIDIFGLKVFGGMLGNLDEGHRSDERRLLYKDDYEKLMKLTRNKKLKKYKDYVDIK